MFDRFQQLREQGRFEDGAKLLQSDAAVQSLDPAQLAAELGYTLQCQGCLAKGLKIWDDFLNARPNGEPNRLVVLRIRMHVCLVRPMVRENLDTLTESFDEATRLYGELSLMGLGYQVSDNVVLIRDTYCKIIQLVSQLHIPQRNPEAFSWLESTFDCGLSNKEYRLALMAARQYAASVSSPLGTELFQLSVDTWDRMASKLVQVEMPAIFKAKALDLTSEFARSLDPVDALEPREEAARRMYDEAGHAFGSMEVDIRRICRRLRRNEGDVEAAVKTIQAHVSSFEQQNFLFGVQHGLQSLQASFTDARYFDLQLNLIGLTNELVSKSGANLFRLLYLSKSMATWLLHSGRAPRVIETGVSLYDAVLETNGRRQKATIANIVAKAYLQIQKDAEALSWIQKSRAVYTPTIRIERAEADTLELQVLMSLALSNPFEADRNQLLQKWDTIIDDEIQHGMAGSAFEKLNAIVTLLIRTRDGRTQQYIQRIESLMPHLVGEGAETKLASFYQNSAALWLSKDSGIHPGSRRAEEEAINLLEKAVPLYLRTGGLVQAANTRLMQALAHFSIFQKSTDFHRLTDAYNLADIAHEAFQNLDVTEMASPAAYWCAFYGYVAWSHGRATSDFVLRQLSVAEKAKNDECVDLSILGGFDAMARRQQRGVDEKVQRIHDMARQVCLRENLLEELWSWTQKSKARGLSDLLALGVLVPEHLRVAIEHDPTTKDMFEREVELMQKISASESTTRINLRNQLHILQAEMSEHTALRDLLSLRAGTPVTRRQLEDLATEARQEASVTDVVFVDWVLQDGQVCVVATRNHGPAQLIRCSISLRTLEEWKTRYVDNLDGEDESLYYSELEEDDPEYCLRQLDALVEAVAEISGENDLLVFCATGILHSIPLHALWIRGEPVIARNPVVYCASLTTAWQCWRQTLGPWRDPALPTPKTVMAVYEETPGTRFLRDEQVRVYESADTLSAAIGADAITGGGAGLDQFKASIETSSLFHFHGHCIVDRAAVTDQRIVLSDGSLSVVDMFRLKLATWPHITLIACDSASQGISARGDEPLGLVTALLCSGASSVLGTLWPIASATGREFSRCFYNEIKEARSVSGRDVINLACCLRAAVLDMRGERRTRRPCHWASFVLHGSPFLR
ncbi:uncharacterized protein J7T54_006356 [Emericellopsis cladophorae]|uniref:CHAT domain-containing protein n=1 Tax=Emericellopsis cladophorae TaxID=2686198 RepID=A0A9Q0BHF9_9HYPO|nr:uncharacterized protein J7T54_006356 [Emericellopsis cladophorae]KAI6786017.1 hypothetical protein J7T54_006356 [Emericellopsis cladophorae]